MSARLRTNYAALNVLPFSFRDEFNDSWEKFEKEMLDLYELKEAEKTKFNTMYYGAIEAVDQKSKAMIADYKLLKKKARGSHL